jgi:DNA repair protein SbcC/Rad50
MIVRSVRLKNIKSYGEGPDGRGVTVYFEPGTNRIAGKNGHGKSTLIESLGYALFLTDPIYAERLQLETYFLRTGAKAAEIDVTFEHRSELFRIERGLGPNNKRLTKVIQVENGSSCAEGDKEVSGFLCRLFEIPNEERIRELFSKLIGVKQGRLTWPFDSTPGDAKKFFEPLLDVAVFRDCFEGLKPTVDNFEDRVHEQEKVRASLNERIRERADSAAKREAKQQQVKEIELRVEELRRVRDEASRIVRQLEEAWTALRAAESQRDLAREALALARQNRENAEILLNESLEAAGIVASTELGYHSFEAAQRELQNLRAKQAEMIRIESEIAAAEKKKIELNEKSNAAISKVELLARARENEESKQFEILRRANALRDRLIDSQAKFDFQKRLASQAASLIGDIRHFVSARAGVLREADEVLNALKDLQEVISVRDPMASEKARLEEEKASETVQTLAQKMAVANAEHESLANQLRQIRGGICPFLKEQCLQFDPSKVEGDLSEKTTMVNKLQSKKEEVETAFRDAQRAHAKVKEEERAFAAKVNRIEQMVASFERALQRVSWESAQQKVAWLREWNSNVEPLPGAPRWRMNGIEVEAFEAAYELNIHDAKKLQIWWERMEPLIQSQVDLVLEEEARRIAEQRDVFNNREFLRQIDSEIANFAAAEGEQRLLASVFRSECAALEPIIAVLDEERRSLEFVPARIVLLEETLEKFRTDYQRYLGAERSADQKRSRESDLATHAETERCRRSELIRSESRVLELSKSFNEADLAVARRRLEEMNTSAAKEVAEFENARREADREEARFREWEDARARRDEIDRAIRRLERAANLAELARVVLRDSAPIVAQHLCDRIAGYAQRIFNRINHDPVELRWEAIPRYSLRIAPGERRYAMLSGGEQTKLALAMTLAMIQEFSELRFCIFDEPTYGVDAESRDKLGEAMLETQRAADLEQLILVSHDDAFDGKIEHTIFLRKTSAHGTEVL